MDVTSDPSTLRVLQSAREEVVFSREWERVNGALLNQLQHLEYLHGRGQLRDFDSLSDQEKFEALSKATRALEKSKEFGEFKTKVSESVDHHFGQTAQRSGEDSSSDNSASSRPRTGRPSDNIVEACTQLLQQWPHLTHKLKKCVNHPLPPRLRAVAWQLLLENPAVNQHFRGKAMAQGGLPELTSEDRRLSHRCETLLKSSPLFHEVANAPAVLRAMKNTVLYWKLRSEESSVSDKELLLCIPFLYVRRRELSATRENSAQEFWDVVAKVVEQFVTFMEMLPLAMHNVVMDVSSTESSLREPNYVLLGYSHA